MHSHNPRDVTHFFSNNFAFPRHSVFDFCIYSLSLDSRTHRWQVRSRHLYEQLCLSALVQRKYIDTTDRRLPRRLWALRYCSFESHCGSDGQAGHGLLGSNIDSYRRRNSRCIVVIFYYQQQNNQQQRRTTTTLVGVPIDNHGYNVVCDPGAPEWIRGKRHYLFRHAAKVPQQERGFWRCLGHWQCCWRRGVRIGIVRAGRWLSGVE